MGLELAFFGTPAPAIPPLQAVIESQHRVKAVVTGPDRARGRGMDPAPTPVKERALMAGVEVLQPETLRSEDTQSALSALQADVFVVVAYGLILPPRVLSTPPLGCINLHFSLLPHLRGPSPVTWTLIERQTMSGITVIQMDEGIDTGPVLAAAEEPVEMDDTAETLTNRLSARGAVLLVEVLDQMDKGETNPMPQKEDLATYAPKIGPEDARIDWSLAGEEIEARVRAFNPKPGAWTTLRSKRIKIWRLSLSGDASTEDPGTIHVDGERILVDTKGVRIVLDEIQPEGGKRMSAAEFVRGHRPMSGEKAE